MISSFGALYLFVILSEQYVRLDENWQALVFYTGVNTRQLDPRYAIYFRGAMDNSLVEVLVWGRVIERGLIVIAGGICLVLGWSLFRSGIMDRQAGEIEFWEWRVALKHAGPGLYFALFGTGILIWSAGKPLSLQDYNQNNASNQDSAQTTSLEDQSLRDTLRSGGSTEPFTLSYAGPERADTRRLVLAVNTLLQDTIPRIDPLSYDVMYNDLRSEARAILRNYKTLLVVNRFGRNDYTNYIKRKDSKEYYNNLSDSEKIQYDELAVWVSGTLQEARNH